MNPPVCHYNWGELVSLKASLAFEQRCHKHSGFSGAMEACPTDIFGRNLCSFTTRWMTRHLTSGLF